MHRLHLLPSGSWSGGPTAAAAGTAVLSAEHGSSAFHAAGDFSFSHHSGPLLRDVSWSMPQDAFQSGWQQQQQQQQQGMQLAGAHLVGRSNSYPGVGGGLSFEGGLLEFEGAVQANALTAAAAAAATGATPVTGQMAWNAAFQPSWQQQQQQGMQLEGVESVSRSHSYPGVGSGLTFEGASLSCEGMAGSSLLTAAAAAAGTMPLHALQQQQQQQSMQLAGSGLGSRSNSYPGIGSVQGLDGASLSFEGVGSGCVLTAAAAAAPVGLPSWSGAAAAAGGVRSQQGLCGESSNSSVGPHPSLQGSSPPQLEQQLL
jgi:hypothetical protein